MITENRTRIRTRLRLIEKRTVKTIELERELKTEQEYEQG